MKQLLQDYNSGRTFTLDVPSPNIRKGSVLIKTTRSLVSAGTERMVVAFAKSSLLDKAKSNPDKVKQVLAKAKTDGVLTTFDAVRNKLVEPTPLGYCNVGVVVDKCSSVSDINIGQRVISNGPHSELVCVPRNLVCPVPDNVSDDSAVFTVLSSIALQGIRLVSPTFGETIVVSGLGLVGLLTIQLLRSNGCKVLGIDPDISKCNVASELGFDVHCLSNSDDALSFVHTNTDGVGADAFIITASTASSDPVHLAAESSRVRGRIVLVGVTGLELRRELFYEKELTFQVSCSYGPGRYDPSYEFQGHDYPTGFVRWTENRNFQACLFALSSNQLNVDCLISHRFPFDKSPLAYDLLVSRSPYLGILLEYEDNPNLLCHTVEGSTSEVHKLLAEKPIVNFIGSGSYATKVLFPAFRKAGALFGSVGSQSGLTASLASIRFPFRSATSDINSLLSDQSANAVVITTRHDLHADFICKALDHKKHVFVEKPLCITAAELERIRSSYTGQNVLMVGFNRRFSPLIHKLSSRLSSFSGPHSFIYTINAGFLPSTHWTQDPLVGGGRLLGECCHFLDLIRFLSGSPISSLSIERLGSNQLSSDTFSLNVKFESGSIASIHYFANGSNSFPKERLEVFSNGNIYQLDNFRKLISFGDSSLPSFRLHRQDKGQLACVNAFLNSVSSGQSAIPVSELFEVQNWLLSLCAS